MAMVDAQRSPLDRFRSFETRDLDEARDIVGRHFCSHLLQRTNSRDRFDARQNRVPGCHMSLNYLRYGADVVIDPGELTDFFLIQIPLKGEALIRNGRSEVTSSPTVASVLNPDLATQMRWHAGCEQLLVQIDRTYLLEAARELTGLDSLSGLRFETGMAQERPAARTWVRGVRALARAAEAGEGFGHDGVNLRHIEECLVADLLAAQPNTLSALLEQPRSLSAPAVLRRALTLVHNRFAEPLSLWDIAKAAGTTPRNLQIVFKRELGQSPISYLQGTRLAYARHLLMTEAGHLPIGEVADLSGHAHFGRFCGAYGARFGESPRETARKTRFK